MVADQSWESCKDCWQVGDGYVSYCDRHRKSFDDQPQKPDASPREWFCQGYKERTPGVCWAALDGPEINFGDKVIEKSAYDALSARVEELESRPATFIKLDETTEAFQQTHAALESLKMFQKDHRELLERFHRCKQEYAKELSAAKLIADTLVGVNEQLSETNAKAERYENALKRIVGTVSSYDIHIVARKALGMTP